MSGVVSHELQSLRAEGQGGGEDRDSKTVTKASQDRLTSGLSRVLAVLPRGSYFGSLLYLVKRIKIAGMHCRDQLTQGPRKYWVEPFKQGPPAGQAALSNTWAIGSGKSNGVFCIQGRERERGCLAA